MRFDLSKGARIYFDPAALPPHPGDNWTRCVCISDTHGCTPAVPDGDILLHSGDIANGGMPESMKSMFDWLRSLPHQAKVCVDFVFDFNAYCTLISLALQGNCGKPRCKVR